LVVKLSSLRFLLFKMIHTIRLIQTWRILACGCLFVFCQSLTAGEPSFLPQAKLDDGWISLFDGETMFGWQVSGEAKWEVADGEIRTDGAKPGWLMTTTRWANYELHVE